MENIDGLSLVIGILAGGYGFAMFLLFVIWIEELIVRLKQKKIDEIRRDAQDQFNEALRLRTKLYDMGLTPEQVDDNKEAYHENNQ